MAKRAILYIMLICFGCDSRSQDFHVYKKGEILPEVVVNDELAVQATFFCDLFEQATGYRPQIVNKVSGDAPATVILRLSRIEKTNFHIYHQGEELIIEGRNTDAISEAVKYFFTTYVGYVTRDLHARNLESVSIPSALSYSMKPAFEYREPYFRDNFNINFREWNNTQTLEETWGLWGHNIGKAITIVPAMMATIDGKVNDEQYCFSSPELESALSEYIKTNGGLKFMIMPNDNDVVCLCDRCKKVGNTNGNSSPAVFTLLDKLAAKFPKQEFFSTAYITTQMPPSFKIAPNAGVMISTMAFPKGILLEQSASKEMVESTFERWKKVTNKIYLWDYAVNYDNYFDAYPTVSIAQQNLKFYKRLGVTGVFMHGSEENYSAFDDLKCFLYAQLLQDTDTDLKRQIANFFKGKYAASAQLLTEYYTEIEKTALASPQTLDIYGGINQSRRKYINEEELSKLYEALANIAGKDTREFKMLSPILASLVFTKLELMRTNSTPAHNEPKVKELTEKLRSYCSSAAITKFNESGLTVSEYLALWNNEIFKRLYRNLLFGKRIKFMTVPDEEYENPTMLNDAAIGFHDYYNNWLLSTANNLAVEINADDVRGAEFIEMGFLNDTRHRIYLPQKIVVTIDGRKYEKVIPAHNEKTISKHTVSIPVDIKPEDKIITIEAVKQDEFAKKSTACDEIYFK